MIPVPAHLAHLPTWHGLPVPTIASWTSDYPEGEWAWRYDHHVGRQAWFSNGEIGDGDPVLGKMNPQRQRRSAITHRCQVCDARLKQGKAWLAVGPGTVERVTIDGRTGTATVVYEPWLCTPCARYAVAVCPGLVGMRRTDALVIHQPRQHLCIMSTAYMDGPLARKRSGCSPRCGSRSPCPTASPCSPTSSSASTSRCCCDARPPPRVAGRRPPRGARRRHRVGGAAVTDTPSGAAPLLPADVVAGWPAGAHVDHLGVAQTGYVVVGTDDDPPPPPTIAINFEVLRLVYVTAYVHLDGAPSWVRFESEPVAVSLDEEFTVPWALAQLQPVVAAAAAYDPDRDIDGPLLAWDAELDTERTRIGNERAARQSDAARRAAARPALPDPTAILDHPHL